MHLFPGQCRGHEEHLYHKKNNNENFLNFKGNLAWTDHLDYSKWFMTQKSKLIKSIGSFAHVFVSILYFAV